MDLSFLDKKDTYSFLMSAIYASKADDNYQLLSDLIYALDNDSFINFLSLFEGQTITIPSIQELTEMIKALAILAYKDIDKLPLDEVAVKFGSTKQGILNHCYYRKLKDNISQNKIKVGGLLDEFIPNSDKNKY